jgi:hypothetical protein
LGKLIEEVIDALPQFLRNTGQAVQLEDVLP